MGIQHENAAQTCSMDMYYGHSTSTCGMDIQHVAWKHAAWTCRKHMKKGHEAGTCSMDMQQGHGMETKIFI
jgi:hypothetical protein